MTSIDVTPIDDSLVARAAGDIDAASAPALERELSAAVEREPDRLIVDLSEVRYIDSAGIDMLVRLAERLRHRRSHLAVVIPPASPLARLAEIVDLAAAMPVHPTVSEGLAGTVSGEGKP